MSDEEWEAWQRAYLAGAPGPAVLEGVVHRQRQRLRLVIPFAALVLLGELGIATYFLTIGDASRTGRISCVGIIVASVLLGAVLWRSDRQQLLRYTDLDPSQYLGALERQMEIALRISTFVRWFGAVFSAFVLAIDVESARENVTPALETAAGIAFAVAVGVVMWLQPIWAKRLVMRRRALLAKWSEQGA